MADEVSGSWIVMTFRIQADQIEVIRRHAEREYPNECCGMLLGRADNSHKVVVEVAALPNVRMDPARAQEILPIDDPGRGSSS
jgi:proteasome lid subunit RPN8/RPN11